MFIDVTLCFMCRLLNMKTSDILLTALMEECSAYG
jgi:hypothetical protein